MKLGWKRMMSRNRRIDMEEEEKGEGVGGKSQRIQKETIWEGLN